MVVIRILSIYYLTLFNFNGLTQLCEAAGLAYVGRLCKTIEGKRAIASDISCECEIDVVRKLSGFSDGMYKKVEELKKIHEKTGEIESVLDQSKDIRDEMLPVMDELRSCADQAEEMVGRVCWPLPSYGELLFSVK